MMRDMEEVPMEEIPHLEKLLHKEEENNNHLSDDFSQRMSIRTELLRAKDIINSRLATMSEVDSSYNNMLDLNQGMSIEKATTRY